MLDSFYFCTFFHGIDILVFLGFSGIDVEISIPFFCGIDILVFQATLA